MIHLLAIAAIAAAPHAGVEQRLPADDIVRAVEREVTEQLSAEGRVTVKVNVAGRVGDQSLPSGRAEVVVDPVQGALPRLRAAVPVRLLLDGRMIRSMIVWVEMHDERAVLTYAKGYPSRHAGASVGVATTRVDMACCDGTPVDKIDDIRQLRTRHAVRAGAPVMRGDFEPLPDVMAQRPVSVEVTRGPIRLVAKGVAMEDGAVGELVALRIEPGQGRVRGRVVGKDRVKVDD